MATPPSTTSPPTQAPTNPPSTSNPPAPTTTPSPPAPPPGTTTATQPPISVPTATTTTQQNTSNTAATTATTATTAPTSEQTSSTRTFISTTDGETLTVTATVPANQSPTDTSLPSNDGSQPKSFFANKGAVAGVFTVVGLVGLALLVALLTNAIRRRRARKFDEDVAAAAAEAAATRYPFEDYDDPAPGGYGAYSDQDSHGTFAQPPVAAAPTGENYGMSEYSGNNGYSSGAAYSGQQRHSPDYSSGMAGFGAGAAVMRNASKSQPYGAFSGPGLRPRDPRETLEAVGLAGAGGTGAQSLSRGPSQNTLNSFSSTGLSRNLSSGTTAYSSDHGLGQGQDKFAPQNDRMYSVPENTAGDAYGGLAYDDPQPPVGALVNPHVPQQPLPPPNVPEFGPLSNYPQDGPYFPVSRPLMPQGDTRMSLRDDQDYSLNGRGQLKVANE